MRISFSCQEHYSFVWLSSLYLFGRSFEQQHKSTSPMAWDVESG